MKKRRLGFNILVILLLAPLIWSNVNVNSVYDSPLPNDLSAQLDVGKVAMDWNLEDIMSDTNMSFSDFVGKVVLMDFFTTWCVPCQKARPLLREVNDHFSSSELVVMSIDLESEEEASESALENFAATYNMNWKIFRDTVGLGNYYEILFIPTLVIFTPEQYIYYTEVGVESSQGLFDIIDEILAMSDSTNPTLDSISSDLNAISVVDSTITVSANIVDDYLREATFTITMGSYEQSANVWSLENGVISEKIEIDPRAIWDATQDAITSATLDVTIKDFSDNSVSDQIALTITDLDDTEDPIVNIESVIDVLIDEKTVITVTGSADDDLKVYSVVAEIWIDDELITSMEMIEKSDGIYSAAFPKRIYEAKQKVSVKLIAKDVAGNTATDELVYKVTGNAGLTIPVILSMLFLGNLVIIPIRKFKTRKQNK